MNKYLPVAGVAIMALLMQPVSLEAAEPVEKTLDMPADGLVSVNNLAGEIEIETWGKAQAWVDVDPGKGVESVEIEETRGGVRVVVHYKESTRSSGDSRVTMKVPVGASIEAQGVSADIEVEGSEGQSLDLESVSGDISAEAQVESAHLKSVSGDIQFEGSASRINAESVSGDVALSGVEGEIRANTVSGDAIIRAGLVRRCIVDTVSGDARVELALADDGKLHINAMSGDIALELPAGQAARITAQTYSGEITSEFGSVSETGSASGGTLQHREGTNDAIIRAETFSGDISIRAE